MVRGHPLLAILLSSTHALQPVLRFRDPKTRGEVILVGCMHYNPASIALAASIVREEASAKRLRACVVESCPTRWNSTLDVQPQGSLLRAICDNEMQAAAEVAEEYGRPVELGDQTIEDTGRRVGQLLALTLVQLLTPAGWQAIYADLREGSTALSCEGEATGVGALLDPALLAGLPVTLVRPPHPPDGWAVTPRPPHARSATRHTRRCRKASARSSQLPSCAQAALRHAPKRPYVMPCTDAASRCGVAAGSLPAGRSSQEPTAPATTRRRRRAPRAGETAPGPRRRSHRAQPLGAAP